MEELKQEKKTNKKEHKKIKMKPAAVMGLIAVIAVAVIGIGIGVLVHYADKQESEVEIGLNQANLKPEDATVSVSTVVTTIEILFEDTAIPVGTTLQVTAIVSPEDTEHALVWSSSNESVFTVSEDGVVTIIGTGTAALTATIGDVSDAVAIEGIAKVTSGSINQYPVYTGGSKISGSENNGSSDNPDNAGGLPESGSAGTDTPQGSSGQGTGNDGNGNSGADGGSGGSNGAGENGTESGNGESSTDITGTLIENGFSQVLSNVYVCQDESTYYGQIVTQPNVTIIYIKQRNDVFDSRIRSVLASLLPEEYQQVWNNYLSAGTDRTFTAEGRRVRIVVASGGGHSQIVIYN